MPGEHLQIQARRVVTSLDASGKSTIAQDGPTAVRQTTDGFTVCDIWRVEQLPAHVLGDDAATGEVVIDPPPSGFIYRVTTFAPDSEWDMAAGYSEALDAIGGADGGGGDSEGGVPDIPGMHQTDTIDIVTVLTGELYAVTQTGETRLEPGDSMVTRGCMHSWSNRTDKPATIVAVQMAATR